MAVAGLWHYNVHSCRVTADREWLLSGSVMDERALSKAAPRLASPRWRCEWGCDSPFPSLCRCLCSRPRQRQRSTWAQHTDLPATESGRHSRCSSRLYHQFWSSSPSPSSIGTWAETDPWSCSCTSCSSDPLSGQWRLVHLHLGFFSLANQKNLLMLFLLMILHSFTVTDRCMVAFYTHMAATWIYTVFMHVNIISSLCGSFDGCTAHMFVVVIFRRP